LKSGAEKVLKRRQVPVLGDFISIQNPSFEVTYAPPASLRTPSSYLQNSTWVSKMSTLIKGIGGVEITPELEKFADATLKELEPRFTRHIDDKVDESKSNHFTLKFQSDNLPAMSAILALCGGVTDDLECTDVNSCLLRLPFGGVFKLMSNDLKGLEGCYLYYDRKRATWIRSGKTSGAANASFDYRHNTHKSNAAKIPEMEKHKFYQCYPTRGVENLGGQKGYFEDLDMYCALAFDRASNLEDFCPKEEDDSLFVWSNETMKSLTRYSGTMKDKQLNMVAYLWELTFELLLSVDGNVSKSPGYETFGLRVNPKKRQRS